MLFASSGFDGPTDSTARFVATVTGRASTSGRTELKLDFHPATARAVTIALTDPAEFDVAVGDLIAARVGQSRLILTFAAWHTMVIEVSEDAGVTFIDDTGTPHPIDGPTTEHDDAGNDAVCVNRLGRRVVVAYGRSIDEAHARCAAGRDADIDKLSRDRLRWYEIIPAPADDRDAKLLRKCVSVMRVNTLAPGDTMSTLWSTPDRIPHRHMWLWDSVFHSFGMNHLNPPAAWQFLLSVLNTQRDDGMIPHCRRIDATTEPLTQPPILAWGVWENYEHTRDLQTLRYAWPILHRYLTWFCDHRTDPRSGLFSWWLRDDPNCRSDESGMDNSPRFDHPEVSGAVDLNVYAVNDMRYAGRIAQKLGDRSAAAHWRDRAAHAATALHERLWHPAAGLYADQLPDGTPSPVRAVSGFLPLLLDDLPAQRIAPLVAALTDPLDFGTPVPVPSVSRRDPGWSTDMWRGPAWINMNYLIILGLRRHGQHDCADRIAEATIATVDKYYQRFGVVFEFYDSADRVPPTRCDRKGPPREEYDPDKKIDSIRDYHWSAALALALLAER